MGGKQKKKERMVPQMTGDDPHQTVSMDEGSGDDVKSLPPGQSSPKVTQDTAENLTQSQSVFFVSTENLIVRQLWESIFTATDVSESQPGVVSQEMSRTQGGQVDTFGNCRFSPPAPGVKQAQTPMQVVRPSYEEYCRALENPSVPFVSAALITEPISSVALPQPTAVSRGASLATSVVQSASNAVHLIGQQVRMAAQLFGTGLRSSLTPTIQEEKISMRGTSQPRGRRMRCQTQARHLRMTM